MRRKFILGLVALFLLMTTAQSVLAVLSCIATDTCLILSNEGANRWGDWVAIETTLEPGLFTGATPVTNYNSLGWYANGYTPSPFQFIGVRYVFEEPTCLEDYQINIESLGVVETQILLAVRRGETWSIVFQDYDYPASTYSWEGEVGGEPVDEIQIQHYGDDPAIRLVAFTGGGDACVPPPEYPDWVRPLTMEDEIDEFPLYDQTIIGELAITNFQDYPAYPVLNRGGLETVHAWSDTPGAAVHAAAAGTIESVWPLQPSYCGVGFTSPSSLDPEEEQEVVYTPYFASAVQPCLVRRYEIEPSYEEVPAFEDIDGSEFYLDPSNAYVVTLRIDAETRISYLVRNALNYVTVGDSVQEGCVLGETMALTALPSVAINFPLLGDLANLASLLSGGKVRFAYELGTALLGVLDIELPFNATTPPPYGYMVMTAYGVDDALLMLAPALTLIPTNTDWCNDTGFNSCTLSNPDFSDYGNGWVPTGNVVWTNPGVLLDPGEQVHTQLNLDPDGDYVATVFTQSQNGLESEIRVFMGSNTQRIVAPVEWTSVQLATEPVGDPDFGDFYTVGVQNTGANPIEVRSICITEDEPTIGPGNCYFNNYTFRAGLSGWTTSEDVEWDGDQSLLVPDLETFSQNVELFPKSGGPATYKLAVYANWWYTGTIDAIATANLAYEWPSGSGYVNMVPQLVSGGLGYGLGTILFTAEIEVEDPTDAVMNFRVDTTDSGSMGLQGLMIGDACLSPVGGGPWPGQGGNTAPPAVNPSCFYIARPRTNDPAAWLQWHYLNVEKVLKCDLMVLLGRMEKTMVNAYTLFGWQARYMQSTLRVYSSWAGDQLFPYFDGHMNNIASGFGGAVMVGENITTSGNIIETVINGVRAIADGIRNLVNVILMVIQQGITLFQLLISLVNGLITAFNDASAVPLPYIPQCAWFTDDSVICAGLWIIDNTILAGPGAAIIPILLSFGSIHLLLYLIAEFKQSVLQQGSVS